MTESRVIRFELTYDGAQYHGWQIQKDIPTVQLSVQDALAQMLRREVKVSGASRTDARVHATGQVVAFPYPEDKLPPYVLHRGLIGLLPRDLSVLRLEAIDKLDPTGRPFHARHCARGKIYRYVLWPGKIQSPFHHHTSWCLRRCPSESGWERAQAAANLLLGTHDFAGFRASDCSATNTTRIMKRVEIQRGDPGLPTTIEVEGSAFLKYMVRIIVGTLVDVAFGKLPVEIIDEILETGDRCKAGRTAPPHGLTLEEVFYPDFAWTRRRWEMPPYDTKG